MDWFCYCWLYPGGINRGLRKVTRAFSICKNKETAVLHLFFFFFFCCILWEDVFFFCCILWEDVCSASLSADADAFGCREQKPHAAMVTDGAEAPQQLLLLLLLQLTEELTGQRTAPQGEEGAPGDPLGGVLGMHQVTVAALRLSAMHYLTGAAFRSYILSPVCCSTRLFGSTKCCMDMLAGICTLAPFLGCVPDSLPGSQVVPVGAVACL